MSKLKGEAMMMRIFLILSIFFINGPGWTAGENFTEMSCCQGAHSFANSTSSQDQLSLTKASSHSHENDGCCKTDTCVCHSHVQPALRSTRFDLIPFVGATETWRASRTPLEVFLPTHLRPPIGA